MNFLHTAFASWAWPCVFRALPAFLNNASGSDQLPSSRTLSRTSGLGSEAEIQTETLPVAEIGARCKSPAYQRSPNCPRELSRLNEPVQSLVFPASALAGLARTGGDRMLGLVGLGLFARESGSFLRALGLALLLLAMTGPAVVREERNS